MSNHPSRLVGLDDDQAAKSSASAAFGFIERLLGSYLLEQGSPPECMHDTTLMHLST